MGRTPCCEKNGLKKGPWTPEEDHMLIDYVHKHGHGSWRTLPKNAGLARCGKSCRLRWTNYLRPDIKRGRFTFEEEETIIQLHSVLGNKWSTIAASLPGRTDNEIKNYWNTHIRKRLLRMGIDPVTHSPKLDFMDLTSILTSSLYNTTQFDVSRLLGIETHPLEFLRLASSLISSHQENPTPIPQTHQEDHFSNPQIQNQLQNFQTQIPEIPICSTSNTQFLNETQLPQSNLEQFPSIPVNFSCQNDIIFGSNFAENFQPQLNLCYPISESTLDPPLSDNSNLQSNGNHTFQNFASVFSTPVSSPTPLNSSSTYINSCTTEDERDSYCSNMLKFQMSELLEGNGFM